MGHAGRFPQPALYDAVGRDPACPLTGLLVIVVTHFL